MLTDRRESGKNHLPSPASRGGLRTGRFPLLLAGQVRALTFEPLVG